MLRVMKCKMSNQYTVLTESGLILRIFNTQDEAIKYRNQLSGYKS